jgi:hypothetical protein
VPTVESSTTTTAATPATFPAYSSASIVEPTDTAVTSELSAAPKIASGASTKIVHPDEDISLVINTNCPVLYLRNC